MTSMRKNHNKQTEQKDYHSQHSQHNKKEQSTNLHIFLFAVGVPHVSPTKEEQTTTQSNTANYRLYSSTSAISKQQVNNRQHQS